MWEEFIEIMLKMDGLEYDEESKVGVDSKKRFVVCFVMLVVFK